MATLIDSLTAQQQVELIYVGYYNRAADAGGYLFWANQYAIGTGGATAVLNNIANSFAPQAETLALYPFLSSSATLNPSDPVAQAAVKGLVDSIYLNLFGRAADTAGEAYWTNQILTKSVGLGQAVLAIANGAQAGSTDYQLLVNKVTVASDFTTKTTAAQLGLNAKPGDSLTTEAAKVLTLVTADPTTGITAAETETTNFITNGGGATGQTFTLVAGADNIVGTTGNDTVNGYVNTTAASTDSTLTAADTINLAGGTADTLNVTFTGTAAVTGDTGASLSGIEVFNYRATNTGGLTGVNASLLGSGVTNINSDRSTSAVVVNNVASGTQVGVKGDGIVTNGASTFNYVAGATASTVNISGGVTAGAVTVTGAGILSTVINSSGAANTLTSFTDAATSKSLTINASSNLTTGAITGAAETSVTVKGAATLVDLSGGLAGTTTTLDASGMTAGGVKATLLAGMTSVKGGAGADTFTVAGTGLTATVAGEVDAGAGTDTLVLTSALTSSTVGAEFVNFENLQIGAFTQDVSKVAGIVSEKVGGAASSLTGMNATQAAAITVNASDAGATFALTNAAGTSDVISFTLQNDTAAAVATPINLTTVTVDGFETMNVAVNSGAATTMTQALKTSATFDAVSFAASASPTVKSLVFTGAYDVNVDASATGASKLVAIDFSALTGGGDHLVTGGQTGSLVVTGSAGVDVIDLGAMGAGGLQTINTGAGNDFINGAASVISVATINGGAGIDTLTLTDAGTVTIADNTFTNVTSIEKFVSSATTGLTDVIGGYANALATANGGVYDLTAANLVSTAAVNIDATGLSAGNSLKLSLTDASGTGGITVTESTGADSITIVQTGATADAITISGGTAALASTAAKTIDLSGVAATTGPIAVTTGAGNDVIKGGTVAETITAGKGADVITLLSTHTGVQSLVDAKGDSGTFAAPAANSISTSSFDVVNGLKLADTLTVTGSTTAAIVTGNDLSAATYLNDTATLIRGTYNDAAHTFVGSATGADSLLVVDTTAGATVTLEATVLVGVTSISSHVAASALFTV